MERFHLILIVFLSVFLLSCHAQTSAPTPAPAQTPAPTPASAAPAAAPLASKADVIDAFVKSFVEAKEIPDVLRQFFLWYSKEMVNSVFLAKELDRFQNDPSLISVHAFFSWMNLHAKALPAYSDDEYDKFNLQQNNIFHPVEHLSMSRMITKGLAYSGGGYIIVNRFTGISVYDIKDGRKGSFDSVLISDIAVPKKEFVDAGNVAVCVKKQAKSTFDRDCVASCSEFGLYGSDYHRRTVSCCACSTKGNTWFGDFSDMESFVEMMMGYSIDDIPVRTYRQYLSALFLHPGSLSMLTDLVALYAQMSNSVLAWVLALLLGVGGLSMRGWHELARVIVRLIICYPSDIGPKVADSDSRLMLAFYVAGGSIVLMMRTVEGPYMFILAGIWYMLSVTLLFLLSRKTGSSGSNEMIKSYIILFLMSSLTEELVNSIGYMNERNVRGGMIVLMYLLVSPLSSSGLFLYSLTGTVRNMLDVSPQYMLNAVGRGNAWVVYIVLVLIWHLIFLIVIRASLSRLSSIYRGNSVGSRFRWVVQAMTDLPTMYGVKQIVFFFSLLIFTGGSIELWLLALAARLMFMAQDAGSFLSLDEWEDVKTRNKNKMILNAAGQRVSLVEPEHGYSVLNDAGESLTIVIDQNVDSVRKGLIMTTEKVSSTMAEWQKKASEIVRTVSYATGGKVSVGKGYVLARTRQSKAKICTIYHVIADGWSKMAEGSTVSDMKVERKPFSVLKEKNPEVFKEDDDRSVCVELMNMRAEDEIGGDVVNVPVGGYGYVFVDGEFKKGKITKVTNNIFGLEGFSVPFSTSGSPVFVEGLTEKGNPKVIGTVASRKKDGTGIYFHGARSLVRIGAHSVAAGEKVSGIFLDAVDRHKLAAEYARMINKKISDENGNSVSNVSHYTKQKLQELVDLLGTSTEDDELEKMGNLLNTSGIVKASGKRVQLRGSTSVSSEESY